MSWIYRLLSPQTWCWHTNYLRERRPDGTFVLVCEHCLHEVTPSLR